MNHSRYVVTLIGVVAIAAVTARGAVPFQQSNRFRLSQIDGAVMEVAEMSVDSTGQLSLPPAVGPLSIDDLVVIESVDVASAKPPGAAGANLVFASGGSVAMKNPRVSDGQLTIDSAAFTDAFPLEVARALVWESSEIVQRLIANPSPDYDALVVRQGDQLRGVEGVVEAVTDQFVQLRYKGKLRKIGLEKVAAVVMADLQLAVPSGRPKVGLQLRDGGTVDGWLESWADGAVVIAVGGQATVRVSDSMLARLSIKSDRMVYLSDLDPISAQTRAMFTSDRPWQRDRSVEGKPLTLLDLENRQEKSYAKGLGTHSWSSLVFANDGSFDRFVATVGIDTETAGRGACRMIVRGDGIELWSGAVTGMSGQQLVDVEIRGIQQIELEVVPGKDFDLADHANWCNARFVKTN